MKNRNSLEDCGIKKPRSKHNFRVVKKTISLLALFLFCANASYAFSQNAKTTINKNNVRLDDILSEIERQTDYLFVYNSQVNTGKLHSIRAENKSVSEVLDQLLENTAYKYTMEGKHIILAKKQNDNSVKDKSTTNQQRKVVTGRVIDEKGETVVGANVIIKGTQRGVVTDFDGKFSIEASVGETIEVSFIGYQTQVIRVSDKNNLEIVLREDAELLDEVLVVGYGTTTKRTLVASVATVNTEELALLPTTNLSQSLAGRAAGLIVQGSGGGVDKRSTISIRGGGTPLVVIDGFIRNYEDFLLLAPDDVESLSILKDASATAVYGSRAANGILQVTTKKGIEGAQMIDYSYNASFSQPGIWPKRMDSWDRAAYANISAHNQGLGDAYSPEIIQTMRDGSDPVAYSNTNWEELALRNFAPTQKHNLRLIGGSKTNTYYISLGYLDQESLYKSNNHNMQRGNFRMSNVTSIAAIGLSVEATVDGYIQRKTHPHTSAVSGPGQVFQMIRNRSPFAPAKNSIGLPYNATGNVYAELFGNPGYIDEDANVANGALAVKWDIPNVKGLQAKATGSYRYNMHSTKTWRQDPAKYNWDADADPAYDGKPQLRYQTWEGIVYNMQYFLTYNRSFNEKHNISALAGYETTYSTSNNYWLSRENYDFPIDQIGPGPESSQKNGGSESESGRAGWIGQLKYNYDNKYTVEASIRRDGSDNFPEHNRWGTFYSGSLGWSIADEAFMESLVDKNIFNSLKLRASYGQVGLDNWGDANNPFHIGRFAYLSSYTLDNKAWVENGAYVPGFSEGAIPSPDITWFTTDQLDFGLDFSSLNDRLYGTIDYFFYKTKGFLYSPDPLKVGYVDPLGMSLPRVSTDGEHRRAGFDFSLGWRNTHGDFSYDISANFTRFDQLWAVKPDESVENLKNPYKRESQQRGYHSNLYNSLGYYMGANDVYNSVQRLGSHNLTQGNLKYEDFNGDGKIDGADQYRMGKSTFPRGNFGINIRLDYKGWYLSTLLQGATSFDMYLSDGQAAQIQDLPVLYEHQTDFWTPSNTDAKYPRLVPKAYNGSNDYVGSNFWLVNGAYLRMKDISVGYNFKKELLRKFDWLSHLNISLSGQNVFTISEATKYALDPENSSVEHAGYPNERIFSININLGFKQ